MRQTPEDTIPLSAVALLLCSTTAGYNAQQELGLAGSAAGVCVCYLILGATIYSGQDPSEHTKTHLLATTAGLFAGVAGGYVIDLCDSSVEPAFSRG